MKKVVFLLFVLVVMLPAFSFKAGVTADLGVVQDLIIKTNSYQANIDFRASFAESYQIRVPVSADITSENVFLEAGIIFAYYPWNKGFYLGLTAFQFGYSIKERLNDQALFNLNEIIAGWTFELPLGFIVEPQIVVRNPTGSYDTEYSSIKGGFGNYGRFRFRILAGWQYSDGKSANK